jgi:zinc protease
LSLRKLGLFQDIVWVLRYDKCLIFSTLPWSSLLGGGHALYNPYNSACLEQTYKKELVRFVKDGVTAAESAAAKAAALQAFQVQRAQDSNLTSAWVQYLTKAEGRTFAYDAKLERRVVALTPEQVRMAAHRYLDYSKLIIVKDGDFARKAKTTVTKP